MGRRFEDEIQESAAALGLGAEVAPAPAASPASEGSAKPLDELPPCEACDDGSAILFPAWNCGACGRKHADWPNRKLGARCVPCASDVPFVHAQCPACDAQLHRFPLGSLECAVNADCHGVRDAA